MPNGFLKLVRDGQNKLQAVDDPRLNEVKLGYAHQVLTLASRLFELMANPIEGLDEVSDSQKVRLGLFALGNAWVCLPLEGW